ncbi:hypothetical protein E2C01_080222 [Portunus trituberculatus]|uniref:Uncharacterized protein n=1 Tax=Portunus trituberculatus TaxID=210409 RepID=A0A5B7IYZ7_PORTR|nr:hypothetical protein [Portunus trituberculatus]
MIVEPSLSLSPIQELQEPLPPPVEKFYFLNVNKVEYKRETLTPTPTDTMNDPSQHEPTHRLVVHDLKVTHADLPPVTSDRFSCLFFFSFFSFLFLH